MVITLSGVTGSGKSYFKKLIQDILKLDNQIIYTTRPIRIGEKNGVDKFFITDEKFDDLKNKKKIILTFDYLEYRYGYDSKKIKSNNNTIIELHYEMIYNLKNEADKSLSIYIIPKDIEIAKQKLKSRHLNKKQEELRLKEIDEQFNNFKNDKNLQKQFDYILYNTYDENSSKEIIEVIKKVLQKNI